jgi:hypothetical protein
MAAVLITDDEVSIEFADSSAIGVSLRDEDYVGPEAFNYTARDGTVVVA